MIFIGIDVGTAGSKATAIDHNGVIKAHAYGEYKAVRLGSGYAEIDPVAVWQTVRQVISQAAAQAGEQVEAIAVASFGESFVALDKHDRVLRNSLLYTDIRGAEEIQDILQVFTEQELFDITGMPVSSMFSLNKLLWLKKHEPDTLARTEKLLLFEDYIYYMLSGERCIDYSLASRTMLFDYEANNWSGKVLDAFGIKRELFSTPVRTGSIIGKINAAVANKLGLNPNVILVAGAHDQICAALGAGVLHKGESVDGIGTSECITVCLDNLEQKEFMRKNNFCIEPYAVKDEYVTLAFSSTGAAIMSWYIENVSQPQNGSENLGKNPFDLIEGQCSPDPTDLLVLPHFAGSGTPHMDPYSTGAIIGLRLSTQGTEIYKACVEGICFEMMYNAELLKEMGTDIHGITCVGGGAKSPFVLQVKADIMGIPVKKLKAKESGTIALAMLCATACGEFSDLAEAAGNLVRIDRSFEPDLNRHRIYQDKYQEYKKLYSTLSAMRNT